MLCFRDRTYCSSPDCRNACGRKFTSADAEAAKRWWAGMKGEPPIAFSPFCAAALSSGLSADTAQRESEHG